MIAAESTLWPHVDGVLVINLDARPERYARLVGEWAVMGVTMPVIMRLPAVAGVELPGFGKRPWFRKRTGDRRWGARAGCTLSHRNAMAHARAQGWQTTLVLEDDADLTLVTPEFIEALGFALFNKDAVTWDVCYLGFSKSVGPSLKLSQLDKDHGLYEVTGCYTTHAYLVRAAARDWILDQIAPEEKTWAWHARHRSIDRYYTCHLYRAQRVLAVSPSLIPQTEGFSDIVQRQVDYATDFTSNVTCIAPDAKSFRHHRRWFRFRQDLSNAVDLIRALGKRWRGF